MTFKPPGFYEDNANALQAIATALDGAEAPREVRADLYAIISKVWLCASGASIGHNRADRYRTASRACDNAAQLLRNLG